MENSKNTSINNRLPRLYHSLEKLEICGENVLDQLDCIMDFGCGQYPVHVFNWALKHKKNVHQYDPYWNINHYYQSNKSKDEVWGLCISNVLNVVEDWSEVLISGIEAVPLPEGPQIIVCTVYEGDRTEVTKQTTKGIQQNKPLAHYLGYCRSFIDGYHWFIRNNMLIGERIR